MCLSTWDSLAESGHGCSFDSSIRLFLKEAQERLNTMLQLENCQCFLLSHAANKTKRLFTF